MKSLSILVLLALAGYLVLPLAAGAQEGPAAPDAPAATFTVNSAADPGSGNCDAAECTLREALIAANANGASKDTINFNIPGAGPHVIALKSALQVVAQPLAINGLSQGGADSNGGAYPYDLRIVINGSGLAGSATGLVVTANDVELRGLVIHRFPSHGVELKGNNGALFFNYIGTNSGGAADFGNGGIGVFINNGGSNRLEGNLISGNDSYGVYVGGANANGNTLVANRIGLAAGGGAALPNGQEGVLVQDAANTRIGAAGNPNVIAGNSGHGILVSGNSPGTIIEGNRIGVAANGAAGIGNSGVGLFINTTGVRVGGATQSSQNLISGNGQAGIVIDKGAAQILRNIIGLNANGAAKIPNNSYGIYIRSSNNVIGGAGTGSVIAGNGQDGIFVESGENNSIQGNFIGTNAGLASGLGNGMFGIHVLYGQKTSIGAVAANAIAYNAADGIYAPNDASQGTRISTNSLFGNGDLGIDLGENGVTLNDPGDGDAGANGLQNFPTLTAAGSNGAATHFVGTLNSQPSQAYRIEFFSAGGCDPSGYGEGRGFVGATTVTTNAGGSAAINVVIPAGIAVNAAVSATATDANGNTSEFSQCRTVVAEKIVLPVLLPLILR